MSEALERGVLLLSQSRHEMAVEQFGHHLAAHPTDAYAHSLLALCLADLERHKEATHHAAEGVRLQPDHPFGHYAMAYVLTERERYAEAIGPIQEAIRLDPYDADYFGLLSRIHLSESRHEQALAAADQGLEVDAENVGCQNLRALALKNLGRHLDAAEALDSALARDPENAVTHANKGWALLEKNKSDEALKHFQEALRIDPTMDWAREGIVTALKSRYRLYSVMLKYFLWMRKLSGRQQWFVVLGVYFGSKALRATSNSKPELAPFIFPLQVLLFSFAILTWLADPLFNLALRFNAYGRLALTREQKQSSTLVGLCLGLSLLCLCSGFFVGFKVTLLAAAAAIGLLALPISSTYNCRVGWPRRVMSCYTLTMALALVFAIIGFWLSLDGTGKNSGPWEAIMLFSVLIFAAGLIGSSWVANLLMMWRPKK